MIDVFVIDDHPIMVDGLVEAFKDKKDNINIVDHAFTGKKALEQMRNTKAQVVILDLAMPGMNGVEVCTIIKQLYPEKKVIVLTGESNVSLLKDVWISGADAILSKYCGKFEIVDTINKVLENKRIIDKDIKHFFEQAMKND